MRFCKKTRSHVWRNTINIIMITQDDMLSMEELSTGFYVQHSQLIYESFTNNFIEFPIHFSDPLDLALKLYHAPFLVFSIDNSETPKYNYLNNRAQQAFELKRDQLNNFLLKDSVPEQLQSNLLGFTKHIQETGKFANYNGLRVSIHGNQFRLNNAYVWALTSQKTYYKGVCWMEPLF